jgi:oxygen-independent coproporphyrinogen-3 oxidase
VTLSAMDRATPAVGTGWRYHPDLLATPVPRYTSYPTAAEFHDGFDGEDLGQALDAVAADVPVSLYIHIPYCRDICWYCGCNTGAANRSGRLQSYLDTLSREIAMVGARLGGRGRIQRIAFGGGSPNAISPDQFDRLVMAIRQAFACSDPVLSVEVDPRGFDAGWALALQRNGVSRVSLGVQTLAPQLQAAIGRVQPLSAIADTVALLRDAGVASINFDLMYGLPAQTTTDLAETLDQALALGPDRLAVFGYAHVPHLIPRQRRIDATALPDAPSRFAQAAYAYRMLTGAGFVPVGFDHFSRPGDALARAAANGTLRRNFQGFTEDDAAVTIGLGASAISMFPDRLLQNEKNAGAYRTRIDAGTLPVVRGIFRSAEDRARGAFIERLLTHGSARLPEGLDLRPERTRLDLFERLDLLTLDAETVILARDAVPYARTIGAVLDAYRKPGTGGFSAPI